MSTKEFKIKKFIGKGTYGTVYKVLRISDQQIYALKEINIKYMSQKEREEAVNEIRLLASVKHENVISYCAAFVENDKLYIVTEYAGNGDLFERIKKRKAKDHYFAEDQIWVFIIQLCRGLKCLHDVGVLHRDLKSPNIFLSVDESVKIGDLGVAKLTKTDQKIARTQIGTPYYLSPEIWRNRPYNQRSDIWSLGVILYELIALRLPFEASTPDQLARKVIRGDYAPLPSQYSRELTGLISKMLVVDAEKRIDLAEILRTPALVSHMNTPQKKLDHPRFEMYRTIKVPKQLSQLMLPSPKYPSEARDVSRFMSEPIRFPKISDSRCMEKENSEPIRKPFSSMAPMAPMPPTKQSMAPIPVPRRIGALPPPIPSSRPPLAPLRYY